MRKGETLEQEQARKKAEREHPKRIKACTDKVGGLCDKVRQMTSTLQNNRSKNAGGEKSGTIPEL